MSLTTDYDTIRNTLQGQVQGTCGLYSFYNAYRILCVSHKSLPKVPVPKKSYKDGPKKSSYSLRQFAKNVLESGQGEVLNSFDMERLIRACCYKAVPCGSDDKATKIKFITDQTAANHPVLVAYLAGGDHTGVIPILRPLPVMGDDIGAHWSLIIGVDKNGKAEVVEPNAPQSLKLWSMDDLLLANSLSDRKTFAQYWEKTDRSIVLDDGTPYPLPKSGQVGIQAAPTLTPTTVKTWKPDTVGKVVKKRGYTDTTKTTRVYDLGGDSGRRHLDQKLKDVLIAVLPP